MSISLYSLLSILLYLTILFFSSLFGSINTLHSSYQLFLQSLYGCVFVFSSFIYMKPKLQKILIILCFSITALLFIGHTISPSLFSFLTTDPYQFILRIQNEHNHLGDFAGIAFVATLLNPLHWIPTILFLLFTVGIMAVSFSKSAFLGVLVVFFVLAIQKKGKYLLGFLIILLISLITIAIYTKEFSGIPLIQSSQKIMTQTLHLNPKPLLSVRDSYYPQVFRAWKSAPLEQFLFGYGPGNYIYPSVKTGVTTDLTPAETHNIFLSIFIESGFLSLFWFLIFCIVILFVGLKQKNPSVYLFLYLLVNFQTDYTYIIPFFMVLFFFFAGQSVYKKDKSRREKIIMGIFFSIILIYTIYSGVTYFSLKQNKNMLETQLTQATIQQDKKTVQQTLKSLEELTPYEESELVKWSSIQEAFGNAPEAIRLLEKLSVYSPRWYLLYLPHQLDLQKKSNIDLNKYLMERKKDFAKFPFTKEEKKQLNTLCETYAKISCVE